MTDANQEFDFGAWMHEIQNRTEAALDKLLPALDVAPHRLHESMRYASLGGGKRVRALLAHGAGLIAQAEVDRLDSVSCAVELIHAYSLVHDDMPCMDDDVLRRGKPTVHVEFGEATALLAGDALQTLAFQCLAENMVAHDATTQLRMLGLLARASGSRGMAGGQALDLEAVGQHLDIQDLEFMHIHKTGALIRASVLLGAMCGNPMDAPHLNALDHYGKLVGLLFQVVDDILDAEADTATLGKTAGKDATNDKPTYVTILGLETAKTLSRELLDEALKSLEPFGEWAAPLAGLAEFIVKRQY